MKTLGALAILAGLVLAGCGYCPPRVERAELRRAREEFRRASLDARADLRRARQDLRRELREARQEFRRSLQDARRDFHREFDRW